MQREKQPSASSYRAERVFGLREADRRHVATCTVYTLQIYDDDFVSFFFLSAQFNFSLIDTVQVLDKMPHRPQRTNATTTTFVPCVEAWIKASHDMWMSVTYSPFFSAIETGCLKEVQWRYYCRDMYEIYSSASKLPTSVSDYLSEEARFFKSQYIDIDGDREISAEMEASTYAKQIAKLLQSESAIIGLIMSVSQGWKFISPNARWNLSEENDDLIAEFRQKINHDLATKKTQFERDNAKSAFDAVLKIIPTWLDHVLEVGNDNVAVPCQCGRPGHVQEQCTFKSHLAPK